MKYYLGVDLGGTSVRVARVDEEGKIIEDIKTDSKAMEGPEAIVENIYSLICHFDLSDIEGIGLAVPGPVDAATDTISLATNIPGCEGYPFTRILSEKTGKKVYLENDANVAGLAEAMLGAGKGKKLVYYITHSTGIGGALIYEGKVISGYRGYAGEIANIIVDPQATVYDHFKHLNRGGVEAVASGKALGFRGQEVFGDGVKGSHGVFMLAREGNEKALAIIDKMAKDFATAIADIACVLAPDCFVIGGGVSNASELYFDKMIAYYQSMVHEGIKDIPILKAEMEEPGVIGAAMTVRSKNA